MNRLIFLSFILVVSAYSCSPKTQISRVEWLLGTWQQKTDRGIIYETWMKKSKSELLGSSYRIVNQDTLVLETIRIIEDNQTLIYIPTVSTQNDNSPISFQLKHLSKDEMVFENLNHDFPNIIAYQRIRSDSLLAYINDKENKQKTRRLFPMKKISN